MHSLCRTNEALAAIYTRHARTVYRVCALFLHGSVPDAEDAVQTTFLKLLRAGVRFRDAEHEKAWLIVTAANTCRDLLASGWRKRVSLDEERVSSEPSPDREDETLSAVLQLPDKYKLAIYMFYYERYACREIAHYMGKSEESVRGYLSAGRKLLKQRLEEGK